MANLDFGVALRWLALGFGIGSSFFGLTVALVLLLP